MVWVRAIFDEPMPVRFAKRNPHAASCQVEAATERVDLSRVEVENKLADAKNTISSLTKKLDDATDQINELKVDTLGTLICENTLRRMILCRSTFRCQRVTRSPLDTICSPLEFQSQRTQRERMS